MGEVVDARVANRRRHREASRHRHEVFDWQVKRIAEYLGVPEENARRALEWLFSDIPLDTPTEKRRR